MKQNQVKIKRVKDGKTMTVTIKNGEVYVFGTRKLLCSCTGNTKETATAMKYKDGEIYCPNCNEKKVEVLQTYEDWKKEEDEKNRKINEEKLQNLHMIEVGSDWECGFKFYKLSAQIDYDDWLKVKKHFKYYQKGWSRGQELEWNYGEPTGWLTRNPLEVEEILLAAGLIKAENTMKNIHKRRLEEKAAAEAEEKALKSLIKECEDAFKDAEKPEGEHIQVDGEKIEDPNFPQNIYGGGHWWVIQKDHIWFIRNNGSDGANWGLNNVATGGAGAIGVRIPYDEEIAKKIRKLGRA